MSLGGTIGDLQSRMGYREYELWCRYRQKYGPLNPVRMYDRAGAMVATQINNAHGGKAKPQDFMLLNENHEVEDFNPDNDVKLLIKSGAMIQSDRQVKIGKRKRR